MPDVTETEPLLDPDCRDGKCGSCVGGPCEHECHRAPAPTPLAVVGTLATGANQPAPERTPPDDTESRCRNHPDEPCTCPDTEWHPAEPEPTAPVTAEGLRDRMADALLEAADEDSRADGPGAPIRLAGIASTTVWIEGTTDQIAEVAMSVRWEDHAATVARLDHALGELASLRDHRARWQTEHDRAEQLEAAIAKVRADCTTMVVHQPGASIDHQKWLKGVNAQATRVLNILAATAGGE